MANVIKKVDGKMDSLLGKGIAAVLNLIPLKYKTLIGGVVFGLSIAAHFAIAHFALFTETTLDETIIDYGLWAGGALAGVGVIHKVAKTEPPEKPSPMRVLEDGQ